MEKSKSSDAQKKGNAGDAEKTEKEKQNEIKASKLLKKHVGLKK